MAPRTVASASSVAASGDPPQAPPEIHYRTAAPAAGAFPGHHRSRRGDTGFEFRGHARLQDAPDPRRLDLHASLRDPLGQWLVRTYRQRMAMPVVMVIDVSASMGFDCGERRLHAAADFTASLAASAWRTGDAFGVVACDDTVRDDLGLVPTRARGAATALVERLRALQPNGRSAEGLLQAPSRLGRLRSLVFLVSDFHVPLPMLDTLLAALALHQVVPVVLWDAAEFALSARRGWLQVVDPESGLSRTVWWRPALRTRWAERQAGQRTALEQVFGSHRLDPLFIEGPFDADAVTRHFHR